MITLATWDSEFFGLRMAHVTGNTLNPQQALEIDDWCSKNRVALAVFLALPDDIPTAHTAFLHQWRMIDFRVVLTHDMAVLPPAPQRPTRAFRAADLPVLQQVARQSFTDSRFIVDPSFPSPERVAEMYSVWLRRRCGDTTAESSFGEADYIIVAEDDAGHPAGFVTCLIRPPEGTGERVGVVDLVAVDEQARGQQLGGAMIRAALHWFAAEGCARVEVVTQGRNVRAQRTYQRAGFLTHTARTWFHRWYIPSP